ncbi:hypothetical protein [Glycomyces buryatensis]|nr:hypothetical protein [Glycomyces buryatensis]
MTALGYILGRAELMEQQAWESRSWAMITLLDWRRIRLEPDQERRIQECRDRQLFEEWWNRALTTATTADEVFDPSNP